MEFYLNIIIGILIGILLAIFVFIISYNLSKPKCLDLNNVLKILIRQAARWTTAANQDNNSLIAVLHANYGAGYWWAVKDIATDTQIKEATGIDVQKFTYDITKTQDQITKNMLKKCPAHAPDKTYLTEIAGEG